MRATPSWLEYDIRDMSYGRHCLVRHESVYFHLFSESSQSNMKWFLFHQNPSLLFSPVKDLLTRSGRCADVKIP